MERLQNGLEDIGIPRNAIYIIIPMVCFMLIGIVNNFIGSSKTQRTRQDREERRASRFKQNVKSKHVRRVPLRPFLPPHVISTIDPADQSDPHTSSLVSSDDEPDDTRTSVSVDADGMVRRINRDIIRDTPRRTSDAPNRQDKYTDNDDDDDHNDKDKGSKWRSIFKCRRLKPIDTDANITKGKGNEDNNNSDDDNDK